jgi:hypothetical protein
VPETPAVSVIIPLYNKRATIERTLRSVLDQTLTDFEIIVVDDGSTDDGPEFIARTFPDPRLSVHTQTNAGPGAARNKGTTLARGALLTFLDADDDWRPNLLERATGYLSANPECGVFTAAFYREPEGVDRWKELRAGGFTEGPWRLRPDIAQNELAICLEAFHPSTAVYRREVIEAQGGYYTKDRCTFGEDVYLWVKILLNNPIYRHLEPLAHYHMEDSELGIGARRGALPIEPVLTDPDPVRAACPAALRDVLETWLAQHALRAAFMQLGRGDLANAAWLLKQFPRIRKLDGNGYARLRLRLALPTFWSVARKLLSRTSAARRH